MVTVYRLNVNVFKKALVRCAHANLFSYATAATVVHRQKYHGVDETADGATYDWDITKPYEILETSERVAGSIGVQREHGSRGAAVERHEKCERTFTVT